MSVKRLGGGSGNKLAAITAAVSGNLEEVTRQLERPVGYRLAIEAAHALIG